jgi:hypothetical protein
MERAARAGAALMLAVFLAACVAQPRAFGQVNSAEQAKAAALLLTHLQPPVAVVGDVSHGEAGDLYRGPHGSCATEEQCRANEVRRHRLAWMVHLTGMEPGGNCQVAMCPLVRTNQVLVIDEIDGSVLYSVQSEGEIGF